jgi:hypothetical protein
VNTNHGRKDGARQDGFALVLAILTLLVLTFLGLSLVATTSTEQQIATNYRWSQQALYNAEAGLEVGKVLLRDASGLDWTAVMPVARAGAWQADGSAPTPAPAALPPPPNASGPNIRNFANAACDRSGGAVGYGVVLNDNTALHNFGAIQYQSSILGQSLNGAFTLWVRHRVKYNTPAVGQNSDDPAYDQLVLTSEGIAPYTPTAGGTMTTLARTNAAVKVLEVEMKRGVTDPCPGGTEPQQGLGPTGNNFSRCASPLGVGCGAGGGLAALGDPSRSQNLAQQGGTGAAGGCTGNAGA